MQNLYTVTKLKKQTFLAIQTIAGVVIKYGFDNVNNL
jgi:hypothetical protein